ncbi:MAG: hypothetical protein A3F91_03420 [Flavobacteria bacterium RIFCSPLOWO2_12_FULL_35_11]|nr:MAG: hypothetical protein A3F91_03420 [Flavobacteria bacterium RIFCSPLOWO2_12_FULL_35_11]
MKSINIYDMPLEKLKAYIDNWEKEHKDGLGHLHCSEPSCYRSYLLLSRVYQERIKIAGKKNNKHIITKYKVSTFNIDSNFRLAYTIYGVKKNLTTGDTVILRDDIKNYITEYVIDEIAYADVNNFKAKLIFTKTTKK